MKSLIKKYLMAIVAVMIVVGFSAFKVVESTIKTTPQDGWYSLDLQGSIDPEDPIHQKIDNGTPTNPDGESCDVAFEEELCMVQLSFPGGYTGPSNITNSTVADLLAAGAQLQSPSYARRDL